MRQSIMLLSGAALLIAGCNSSTNEPAANENANRVETSKPKPKYCFFKDDETKGWTVSASGAGEVTVKGKAHVKDARYRVALGPGEVAGAAATISPTLAPNTTGYASPDNWWDVSATIPGSGAVETVTVECGSKQLAELEVKRK
jgi:hypothetical protein